MLKNFDDVHIGTKLRVRKDLQSDTWCGKCFVVSDMAEIAGTIVTVSNIYPNIEVVRLEEIDYSWTPEMFEDIVSPTISLTELLSDCGK